MFRRVYRVQELFEGFEKFEEFEVLEMFELVVMKSCDDKFVITSNDLTWNTEDLSNACI
jgi:hypothetical protein